MEATKIIALEAALKRADETIEKNRKQLVKMGNENGYRYVNYSDVIDQLVPAMRERKLSGSSFEEFKTVLLDDAIKTISPNRSKEDNAIFSESLKELIDATHEQMLAVTSTFIGLKEMKKEDLVSLFKEIEGRFAMAERVIKTYEEKFGHFPLDKAKVQEGRRTEYYVKKAEGTVADLLVSPPQRQIEGLLALSISAPFETMSEAKEYAHKFMEKISRNPEAMAGALNIPEASTEKKEELFELLSNTMFSSGIHKREVSDTLLDMMERGARGEEMVKLMESNKTVQIESLLTESGMSTGPSAPAPSPK